VLEPGQLVPPFELPDQDGVPVSNDTLSGRQYLLYWYPMADTPACTAQAEGLRDQFDTFTDHECLILGASRDEPAANKIFQERYRLPFRLLSDRAGTTAAAHGAVSDPAEAHPRRVAYLVGRDGAVQRAYTVTEPGYFADSVLDDLDELNP
jgi:peroxiredoxin Q/BCP